MDPEWTDFIIQGQKNMAHHLEFADYNLKILKAMTVISNHPSFERDFKKHCAFIRSCYLAFSFYNYKKYMENLDA